jgi:adenylate cyclase
MRTHVEHVFQEAERRTERVTAYVRLAVVLVLFVLFLTLPLGDVSQAMRISFIGYALLGGAGLFLAHRNYFRPWLPWLFTTIEVGLLLNFLALLVIGLRVPVIHVLMFPSALMIFVFLSHAAVRFRPALVLYTAALFLAGWLGLLLIDPAVNGRVAVGDHPMPAEALGLAGELFRLAVVLLVAAALCYTAWRSRKLLLASIVEARRHANLARYFPEAIVAALAHEGAGMRQAIRRQSAAVMFADMQGFTALTESMDPVQAADLLNEFRRRVTAPIAAHGGMLDKFIGDAVMAVFGTPEPGPGDARAAVLAGLEILASIQHWSQARVARGEAPVKVGIGIHYGTVVAGVLGDDERLEYTVIGDTVNVAQRVERLTRELGEELVVTADVLAACDGNVPNVSWQPLPAQHVRGRVEPVHPFRLAHAAEPQRAA